MSSYKQQRDASPFRERWRDEREGARDLGDELRVLAGAGTAATEASAQGLLALTLHNQLLYDLDHNVDQSRLRPVGHGRAVEEGKGGL